MKTIAQDHPTLNNEFISTRVFMFFKFAGTIREEPSI